MLISSQSYLLGMEPNPYFGPLIEFKNNQHLLEAIYKDKTELISKLLEQKADVNFQTDYGNCALNMALFKNNFPILKLLADKGANPFVSAVYYKGTSKIKPTSKKWVLSHISIYDSLEKKYLEDKNNTDLKAVIEKFKTTEKTEYYRVGQNLIKAVQKNKKPEYIQTILDAQVDPNFTNMFGNSALNIATSNQNIDLIKRLVKAGASVHHNACIITINDDTTISYKRSNLSILQYQQQLYVKAASQKSDTVDNFAKIIITLGGMISQLKTKSRKDSQHTVEKKELKKV